MSLSDFEDDSIMLDSDDSRLEEIIQRSRLDAQTFNNPAAGPSRLNAVPSNVSHSKDRLDEINTKIDNARKQSEHWQRELEVLIASKERIERDLVPKLTPPTSRPHPSNGKGKAPDVLTNYYDDTFPWSDSLRSRLKTVFGHDSFRVCQEAICNAVLDGQDTMTVMPTAAGKSLTYQLPAIFCRGLTIVISPLIALMNDQIQHLKDVGVSAVMLTSATDRDERNQIFSKISSMKEKDVPDGYKLLYLSPEMYYNNDGLKAKLDVLHRAKKLARFVIDEAHCIAQDGHDFRPDYLKLSSIRKLWPDVPISALSATCPPGVFKQIHSVLRLKRVQDGRHATPGSTIYFKTPLYRKNLHYRVIPKDNKGKNSQHAIGDYIKKNHPTHSGIVYCLRIKDTDEVSKYLNSVGIKSGTYSSKMSDNERFSVYHQWKTGKIQVICATVAFGMGIDKGDVRFVIHHSISKSLEAYYQESGRAGRDGRDADCVLFYRPHDGYVFTAMGVDQMDADTKVYAMMKFAQDIEQCRKVAFAEYFSTASDQSIQSWSTHDEDARTNCGHCDNCLRDKDTIERRDVTFSAWQLMKLAEDATRVKAKLTFAELVKAARGNTVHKLPLTMGELTGDNVRLSAEKTEKLVTHLVITKYLSEIFSRPQSKTNGYITLGVTRASKELLKLSREEVEQGKGTRLFLSFVDAIKPRSRSPKTAAPPSKNRKMAQPVAGPSRRANTGKRKHHEVVDDESEGVYTLDLTSVGNDFMPPDSPQYDVSDFEDDDWSHVMGSPPRNHAKAPPKRPRRSLANKEDPIVISDSD